MQNNFNLVKCMKSIPYLFLKTLVSKLLKMFTWLSSKESFGVFSTKSNAKAQIGISTTKPAYLKSLNLYPHTSIVFFQFFSFAFF